MTEEKIIPLKLFKKYVDSYPETVRLIDKENGGHGSTINAGIKGSKGKIFSSFR